MACHSPVQPVTLVPWRAQDVLTHVGTGAGGAPMTMAEATLIADNALEHTARVHAHMRALDSS